LSGQFNTPIPALNKPPVIQCASAGQNPRLLKSGEQSADYYRTYGKPSPAGKSGTANFTTGVKTQPVLEQATIARSTMTPAITNYIAIKDDITARKEAEEACTNAQSNFSSATKSYKRPGTIKTLSGLVPLRLVRAQNSGCQR